jgi:hypothetical protein
VRAVLDQRPGAVEIEVEVDGARAVAVAYPELSGRPAPGDRVLLNVTAVELGLGTGGVHLVVAIDRDPAAGEALDRDPAAGEAHGRVMKARYTPLQNAVSSVEETDAVLLEGSPGLRGVPVVCAPLHSMIAPIAAGARTAGAGRIVYVMTDGAALPGAFSRLVPRLREAGLLDSFITSGQSFGGELEAVTVWTGLLAARELAGGDVVIVADGPGNLGTETRFGVSALGSGEALNAAGALGGQPMAALRISFMDPRERHRGLSHHSLTILRHVCLVPATAVVPRLGAGQSEEVWAALRAVETAAPRSIGEEDGAPALEELERRDVAVESMGRSPADDPAFFLAAGAAGVAAARLAARGQRGG